MTKITVFNEKITDKKLKPIEFIKGIDSVNCKLYDTNVMPRIYSEITVIRRNSFDELDLFICKSDDKIFHKYLGHFNDGIVE